MTVSLHQQSKGIHRTVCTWTPRTNNSMPPSTKLILLLFPFFQTWHLGSRRAQKQQVVVRHFRNRVCVAAEAHQLAPLSMTFPNTTIHYRHSSVCASTHEHDTLYPCPTCKVCLQWSIKGPAFYFVVWYRCHAASCLPVQSSVSSLCSSPPTPVSHQSH